MGVSMPIDYQAIGRSTEFIEHQVDARWLMAYAAGLRDFNAHYLDTEANVVCAHPVFPVCLEWPSILATRNLFGDQLTQEESSKGVHASHDLHIYRPIMAGEVLRTTAKLIGIRKIKPGAGYDLQIDSFDKDGKLVFRTYQFGIYRGVATSGSPITPAATPLLPETSKLVGKQSEITILEGAAHTYTECARIWNPIHTDRRFALAAGLPDIILHGTATLALAVSELVNKFVEGDPKRVKRLGGKFSAMVFMPSALNLATSDCIQKNGHTIISFELYRADGAPAISEGFLVFE